MIRIKGKKINPEKSNRLIWAVAGGLSLLAALAAALILFSGRPPRDKVELMRRELSYLKNTTGIIEIRFLPEQDTVAIVYDRNSRHDFETIARFAGLRLANRLKKVVVELHRDRFGKPVYRVRLRDGAIAGDERPAERPTG